MAVISDEEIAKAAWVNFGDISQQQVVIMTAIALAESSGDKDVLSPGAAAGGEGAYGLWQIQNNHKDWFSPSFYTGLYKIPLINGSAARVIYNAQGNAAWEVYTNKGGPGNGTYSQFLPRAQKAVAATKGKVAAGPIQQTGQSTLDRALETILGGAGLAGIPGVGGDISINPDGTIDTTINTPLDAIGGLFDGLQGALWIGGGAILVILGVIMLAKDATPVGKIASMIK